MFFSSTEKPVNVQFSSVTQSCSIFAIPWTAASQTSLSIANTLCFLTLMSIESVMPSNHLILCCPLLPAFNLSQHQGFLQWVSSPTRWPKYWSFNFSVRPSNEYAGLITFRIEWLDLLAVQGTLQESSPTPPFKNINSSAFSFLYTPNLTSIHDYWKNCSFD